MLYSTIRDMENLIEDLKLKVSKADGRADNAEEKLIILSVANARLTEELSSLRDKLECLEASLHQVEETKLATARDIGIRTKVITNLVMQLAIERERLYQQLDKTQENASVSKTEVESVDLTSELGTLRRIDAGLLNYKQVFMPLLIVLVSAAAYFFQKQNWQF